MNSAQPPLTSGELARWAHEHLVYEAGMLAHSVERVADTQISNPDRNAFVESFAIHVRCLRDFLWKDERPKGKPQDALAADFCAPGVWAKERPELPAAVEDIEGERNRIGREIVHLTYHRLHIGAEAKEWDMSELLRAIAEGLARLAELAAPACLTDATRETLAYMPKFVRFDTRLVITPGQAGVTGASQMIHSTRITGGTVAFPGYSADELP